MTENKRFECYDLIFLDGYIKDTLTNEIIEEPIKLMNLLNKLSHEILVGDKLELFKQNKVLMRHNNKLIEENKELKEELRIYRQVANCHNCTYHDYDWYDDGDEFEVCRKGNDVSEGICKDWEEL